MLMRENGLFELVCIRGCDSSVTEFEFWCINLHALTDAGLEVCGFLVVQQVDEISRAGLLRQIAAINNQLGAVNKTGLIGGKV